jgi:uncharacterized membrane protein
MTNEPVNPFEPPKAALDMPPLPRPSGSLEDGVAGRYDFTVGEVMSEAWGLVKGFKASFWGAALLMYALFIGATLVWGGISGAMIGKHQSPILAGIVNGLIGALMAPLLIGVIALAIRRAAGLPVSFSMAFAYLNKAPVLIGAGLLTTLLTYLGFALLIIPGIYLGVAYGMTLPLLAFHELGPWKAMEMSRKAITHKWFRVFGLYLLVGLLVGLSALPLGIPLIWTLPWAMLVMGVLYRRIFGGPAAAPP